MEHVDKRIYIYATKEGKHTNTFSCPPPPILSESWTVIFSWFSVIYRNIITRYFWAYSLHWQTDDVRQQLAAENMKPDKAEATGR